jgi:hypothetical protein
MGMQFVVVTFIAERAAQRGSAGATAVRRLRVCATSMRITDGWAFPPLSNGGESAYARPRLILRGLRSEGGGWIRSVQAAGPLTRNHELNSKVSIQGTG